MASPTIAKPDFSKTPRDQNPSGLDRLPPHSIEVERGVLGSIFLDPGEGMSKCETMRMGADHFYDLRHQVIFQVVRDMHDESTSGGSNIELTTVTQRLIDKKLIEKAGGIPYLTETATSVVTAANLDYYLRIVREKFLLRQIIARGTHSIQEAYEIPDNVEEFIDRVERQILEVREGSLSDETTVMKPLIHKAIQSIEKSCQNKGSVTGLSTGFKKLDEITTGMHPANMIILAARPSMGKTALALNLAEYVGVDLKKPVGIFSLEMSADDLTKRLICSRARVNAKDVATGFVDEPSWTRITHAASELVEAPIYINDTGGLTIGQLRAIARRMKQRHKVELLIIDYLQLISSPERGRESRQAEISDISRTIKSIAKELQIPVIALSQLNRRVEDRDDKRPNLSDLRESGSIEQDADVVMLLVRPEYYAKDDEERDKLKGKATLIIAKQRNGPIGDVHLTFINQYTRFENVSYREESEESDAPFEEA
ncbi:MAG: replicative DNA helicase [Verrucomicrobiae bacterium]|nr:replicative DNA helicase [Verrucomicrobiae bacterium]